VKDNKLLEYLHVAEKISPAGFSLIEVTLAVGIIGFCLIAVLGLLPTGLNTYQVAQEESRAGSALDMVASAIESLHPMPRTTVNSTWAFPNYFSNNPDLSNNPTVVWVTQNPWNYTFFLSDGGQIIANTDMTTRRRQTLYVRVYPPHAEGQAVQIYAAIAWPYKASDTNTTSPAEMLGRQGFIDTFVAYTPKPSY
jgi:type II secretory pathway pseudopilin PulG